ncbi:MAG: hypothetical protein ACR2QW_19840 [bacterium]
MEFMQDALQWIYIAICFVLIWHGISLILGIWYWLIEERKTKRILGPLIKLAVTSVLAKAVVWLGSATSI